ncbi:MAG: P1 family peptidase [Actinomycetota bacterium]|nr:P1 family peptidase [Actinomycetota bacterium]
MSSTHPPESPEPRAVTNDTLSLSPRTTFAGRRLEFDFPGLEIGVAEYDEGPTGCTVFRFPGGATQAVDVRGGSPGVVGGHEWVHAICLAGGSLYGLEAAAGVSAELFSASGYSTAWNDIKLVSGAIIFDYGRRGNGVYPDKELGRAAARAARPGFFPLGARGAGRSATVGKTFEFTQGEPAGQGGAFRELGTTKIGVFSVVNSVGAIVDREGRVVRGHLDNETRTRGAVVAGVEQRLAAQTPLSHLHGNTTLTVVVTNERLARRPLTQLARQVHASMARAIHPFHTLVDGDVLYAVTTNEVENRVLDSISLSVVASELAWDAVLASFDAD